MDFFISPAMAEAAQQQPDPLMSMLPLIIIFVIFYFLLIRPQMKRQKEHKAMVEALSKGDEIVTQGGILGKVIDISDSFVTVEIASNTQIKMQRHAVGAVLPKGTLKSADS